MVNSFSDLEVIKPGQKFLVELEAVKKGDKDDSLAAITFADLKRERSFEGTFRINSFQQV